MPLPLLVPLALLAWAGLALIVATVAGYRWQTAKPRATHTPPTTTTEEGTR